MMQPAYEAMLMDDGSPRPSPYRGCWFKFQLEFTASYPHECPKVSLLTPTYHTHVGADGLKMCATYMLKAWGTLEVEKRSIFELFKLLRSFFASPSGDRAVNSEASKQLLEDLDAFEAKAREMAGGDEGDEEDDDDDDDEE
jgi:ubiquitin-protein ligase